MHETTALGAAIAAGFAIGIWTTFDELKHMNRANRTTFDPVLSPQESGRMYKQWTKAVEMCRGWLDTSEIGIEDDDDEEEDEQHDNNEEAIASDEDEQHDNNEEAIASD
jgi:glycerol kinase